MKIQYCFRCDSTAKSIEESANIAQDNSQIHTRLDSLGFSLPEAINWCVFSLL